MIENYLKAVSKNEEKTFVEEEISPIVKSLIGSFKMPVDFDYKAEMNKIRDEKYQKCTSKYYKNPANLHLQDQVVFMYLFGFDKFC